MFAWPKFRNWPAPGRSVGLLAANTPHIVFDEIRRRSPIPLVSIVEATCEAARPLGLKRLGLFGTRFTMQGNFYPDVFSEAEIALVVPQPDEQAYIHDKYMGELVKGNHSARDAPAAAGNRRSLERAARASTV